MKTQTSQPNQDKLSAITNASHTSVITMVLLALRKRDRNISNVTNIKEQLIRMGEKVVDEDYIQFWKDLETAEVGRYIVGRRGNPDRFKWHFSLKEIAHSAIEGKSEEMKSLAQKKDSRKVVASSTPKKGSGLSNVKKFLYAITLPNGIVAEVLLPKRATKRVLEEVREALAT